MSIFGKKKAKPAESKKTPKTTKAPVAKESLVQVKVTGGIDTVNAEGRAFRVVDGVVSVPAEVAERLAKKPEYEIVG